MCQNVLVKIKKLNSLTNTYDEIDVKGQIVSMYCDDIDRSKTYRVSISNEDNSLSKKKYVDISADKEYYKARFNYLEKYPDSKTELDTLNEKRMKAAVEKENKLRLEEKKRRREFEVETKRREEEIVKEGVDTSVGNELDSVKIYAKNKKIKKPESIVGLGFFKTKALLKTTAFVQSTKPIIAVEPFQSLNFRNMALLKTSDFIRSINPINAEEEESFDCSNIISSSSSVKSNSQIYVRNLTITNGESTYLNKVPLSNSVDIPSTLSKPNDISCVPLINSHIIPPKVISRTGRGIRSAYNDTYQCECGCEMVFDKTEMVHCSGGKRNVDNTNCQKLLNRRCCPNWICRDCVK